LTVFSNFEADESEREFIDQLRKHIDIPEKELDETIMFIQNFIITNQAESEFLNDAPSYERVYGNFLNRWKKVLTRNKEKLAIELGESKELVALMKKSMIEDLTPEERVKVRAQLKDVLKSMPAVAIFLIPGGSLLLPMMVKIIPDILPSAFKDNEIEEPED
ncbi:MAG: LETM1 domain-containing protein, partial [Crocinitomicaceae bacterium]|nr:LETM1 domain-containing protein [Crocinitomicaceae bacterium]